MKREDMRSAREKPRWLRSCRGPQTVKRICQPKYARQHFNGRKRERRERKQLPKRRLHIMSEIFNGTPLLNKVGRRPRMKI